MSLFKANHITLDLDSFKEIYLKELDINIDVISNDIDILIDTIDKYLLEHYEDYNDGLLREHVFDFQRGLYTITKTDEIRSNI